MGAGTEQLTSLLPLILLGVVFLVIILLLLPQLANFGHHEPEAADDAQSDSALQPLRKIFLEYKHSSVNDWINWIKSQDLSRKSAAFTNLISYLDNAPGEIGAIVTEVIKAVIAFEYPESFTSLHRLLENVRKQWGSYHTADQFYAQAAQGLVELNNERAQSILMSEFELIKNKHDSQRFMMAISEALSELPSNDGLDDFWFEALVDPLCNLSVKEDIIELLTKQDVEARVAVASRFFKFWNKSEMKKLSDNDLKIIEKVFYSNQDIIIMEHYDLWSLVLEACDKELTETLMVSLVAAIIENTPIKEELLLELFDAKNQIRNEFMDALGRKNSLSEEEFGVIRAQYIINIKKSPTIVDIKKYKKTKEVPESLNDAYQHLVRALSLDQEFKNHNLPVLNFILGQSLIDKQYLVECLAANFNRKLLNVNLPELLASVTELAKFKPLINQSKPCVIYFYGLSDLVNRKLSDIETTNLELLNNLFKELKTAPGINFLTSVEISQEVLTGSEELQEIFKQIFKLKYGLIRDIDKPDILSRQKLFNDCVKKIAPNRIKSSAGLELIAKQTEDYSLIEFLSYMNSYVRYCLLIYGELKSPVDLDIPGLDLNDKEDQGSEKASI